MTTIDVMPALRYLARVHGVRHRIDHTGGGNYVVGLGDNHGYDDEQGTDAYDVNIGPVYREFGGPLTGESGDLYLVSRHPRVPDTTVHVTGQLLPTVLRMLGIEDVTVDDPTLSLDDIAEAMGAGWSVACLGGNVYGVADMHGTMITLDAGAISFLPASITIGRQAPTDDEWREVWSGTVWDADTIAAIVADRL